VQKGPRPRYTGFLIYLALATVAFSLPLFLLARYAAGNDLDSYILLVPFISTYLAFLRHKKLSPGNEPATGWASAAAAVGATALAANWYWGGTLDQNDSLSLVTLAYVCALAAGGFLFAGYQWMAGAAFPFGFLLFMVPLPDMAVGWLETASRLASIQVAAVFFDVTGVPALHDGAVFQLPDISIRVGQECSGIHSSWILIMASLLASHMVLRTPWRRALLVAFAIPLGVVRNGFRILTLGWLCIHIGPQMIDSPIHHQGGPIFFLVSLAPFFLLLWILCRGERKRHAGKVPDPLIPGTIRASRLQPD